MSFDYRIACASSVSQVCETNRSNFFADGKSMKKGNRGTTTSLIINGNSDSEQIVGLFDGVTSAEIPYVAIGCLRYFVERKAKDDTEYLKNLERLMMGTDKVVSAIDTIADKRLSCAVAFLRYNGFYFTSAGDTLVFLLRSGEIKPLNSTLLDVRPIGGEGFLTCAPICGELQSGDRIVICTNSLKKSISRDKFVSLVSNTKLAEECASKLCEAVTERGIADCASCLVIDVLKKTSEGYWILPSFVEEVPSAVSSVDPMLEAPTVEVLSGAVYSKSEKPEPEEPKNEPNNVYSGNSYYTPAQKAVMDKPNRNKNNNKKSLTILIVALVAILAVIIVSVVVALSNIGRGEKDDPSISDSDMISDSDTKNDPEPENDDSEEDDTSDDTSEDTSDVISDDTSDDTSEDSTDDSSDTSTDDSSDTSTDDSSEESSNEEQEQPEEPVGNESGTTSRGYTVFNKNGAYYVSLGSTEILVANKTYELDENYNPGGLTSDTRSAFNNLVNAAGDAGYTITNISGFRSYATQQRVYNGWVNTYGTKEADRISARPGHSEHQSGLAIDVNSLDESFGQTDTGKWLASNAHKYGFIIRYPEGKEHITGYSYEPWHIRYVGEIAADIYESGLTLEEYLGITSSY